MKYLFTSLVLTFLRVSSVQAACVGPQPQLPVEIQGTSQISLAAGNAPAGAGFTFRASVSGRAMRVVSEQSTRYRYTGRLSDGSEISLQPADEAHVVSTAPVTQTFIGYMKIGSTILMREGVKINGDTCVESYDIEGVLGSDGKFKGRINVKVKTGTKQFPAFNISF